MSFLLAEGPIRWVFLMHALCGAIALGILFIPMLAQKGGRLHVWSGWIYTGLMVLVGVSALIITPWRAFLDPGRTETSQAFALFLSFVALLTLTALWHGLVVLRFKNRKGLSRAIYHIGPAILLALSAAGVLGAGFKFQNVLLMTFPLLGFQIAYNQLRYWLKAPSSKMHWWYAHMEGMFTACIATITAFLVTALPRLTVHPIAQSPILWIAPGLLLGVVLRRWTIQYQKKFREV